DLVGGFDDAAGDGFLRARIGAALHFVNVVADVQAEIDVFTRGGVAVGVEIAPGQVGAGEERHRKRSCRAHRRAAGPARDRGAGGRKEAIEVAPTRQQPLHVDLGAIIGDCGGGERAATGDAREVLVFADFPGDAAIGAGGGDEACPQYYGVGGRVAGGDAVG